MIVAVETVMIDVEVTVMIVVEAIVEIAVKIVDMIDVSHASQRKKSVLVSTSLPELCRFPN